MGETSKGVLLIVDDEPLKCATLRIDLTSAGYAVLDAPDAATGLKHLAERQVDVVVTDLRMPGMDGLEFLQQIKAQSPRTQVIMMTAFGTVDSAVEAMKNGACDYIAKPFSSEVLLAKLEKMRASQAADAQPAGDLGQLISRAFGLSPTDTIRPDPFVMPASTAPAGRTAPGLNETIAGVEKTLIDAALRRAAGNQAKAAQFLRIPRTTLRDKMAKYGMVGGEAKREVTA